MRLKHPFSLISISRSDRVCISFLLLLLSLCLLFRLSSLSLPAVFHVLVLLSARLRLYQSLIMLYHYVTRLLYEFFPHNIYCASRQDSRAPWLSVQS